MQIDNRTGDILKLSYFCQNFNVHFNQRLLIMDPKLLETYFSSLVYLKSARKTDSNHMWIKWTREILVKLIYGLSRLDKF